MENGAEEAESRRGTMPAVEDHGKTAHDASVNARRVMERNMSHTLQWSLYVGYSMGTVYTAV